MLNWAPLANAQKAGDPIDLRGYATGQTVHVGALEGPPRIADAEVAWASSSVDADANGLAGAKLNEVNRQYQTNQAGKLSYARASGLEVGLGTNPTDANQVILAGLAEAAAAPSTHKNSSIGPVKVDPLAYAKAVSGDAVANANSSGLVPDVCVLGDDLSRGTASAADVQLVNAGGAAPNGTFGAPVVATDADPNYRAVSNSVSHEKLVPTGTANNFGLMSEVRQTIAPVTLLATRAGSASTEALTIEALGEWVLRVVATGGGGSSVFYGPGTVNPETPVLRIFPASGNPTVLKLQDILGAKGLDVPIPGLADITIGEAPRAIAKPGADPVYSSKPTITPTKVSAAVDVVRVRLLGGTLADVRVGHMEAEAEVPAGGVNCPIPVTKTADPDSIRIREQPDTSHITITVHNVYNCDLTSTVLTDHIKQQEGDPDFQLTAADPSADSPSIPTGNIRTADVVWSLGTIPKGSSKAVTLDLKSATSGGVIRDIAEATGKMANCTGQDASGLAISGLNLSGLSVPVDVNIEIPRTGPATKNTVATGLGLLGIALAGAIAMRRRSRGLGRT